MQWGSRKSSGRAGKCDAKADKGDAKSKKQWDGPKSSGRAGKCDAKADKCDAKAGEGDETAPKAVESTNKCGGKDNKKTARNLVDKYYAVC